MKLKKWNYKSKKYDDYEVPDDWKCKTYSNDMEEVVNCPHCGMAITFGSGYTSREIHTEFGFGYTVCPECYKAEWEREKENE